MYLGSGISGLFQLWHENDHVINAGAAPVSLMIPCYVQANTTIAFFDSLSKQFPYAAGNEFFNPHHWHLNTDNAYAADLMLVGKGNDLRVTIYSGQTNSVLYCEDAAMGEDIQPNDFAGIQSFGEIINSELARHKAQILGRLGSRYLKFIITAQQVIGNNKTGVSIENPYFNAVCIVNGSVQTILLAPKWQTIMQDNILTKTRIFENNLLENLIVGARLDDIKALVKIIHQDDDDKRTSGMAKVESRYYIEPNIEFSSPKSIAFRKARQIIASVVYQKHARAGRYRDFEATKPLRLFSDGLRSELIKLIKQCDKQSLLIKLMNYHAADLFQILLHHERINTFAKNCHLMDDSRRTFREKTIALREETKQYQRVLEYLIEAAAMHGISSNKIITGDEFETMVALAKWILDFQSIDNQVSAGASNWATVEIHSDGVVDLLPTTHANELGNEITQARYQFGDYDQRDSTLDERYYLQFQSAFYKDTGTKFDTMVAVLDFLSRYSTVQSLKKQNKVKVIGNVVEANLDVLANEIGSQTALDVADFYQVVQLLYLDPTSLSNRSGFIPTWEKKRRSNKYVAKPFLFFNKQILYTPANLYNVHFEWTSGVFNFTLPYQAEMGQSKKVIGKWKKEYENVIVTKVESLFETERFKTYINEQLYKLDKKGNHPRNLGDYDVVAIDAAKHEVWIVEVKYLRLDQTASENINSQSEYFIDEKSKGEKFLRRVNYFGDHLDSIMHNLGISGHFVLKSYFVSNKVVRSQFKEFPFQIMGFNEFRALIG